MYLNDQHRRYNVRRSVEYPAEFDNETRERILLKLAVFLVRRNLAKRCNDNDVQFAIDPPQKTKKYFIKNEKFSCFSLVP